MRVHPGDGRSPPGRAFLLQLRRDHLSVLQRCAEIEERLGRRRPPHAAIARFCLALTRALPAHFEAEERYLPLPDGVAADDHQHLRRGLEQLRAASERGDPGAPASAAEFIAHLRRHIAGEEADLSSRLSG